jgi:hypothetical protein
MKWFSESSAKKRGTLRRVSGYYNLGLFSHFRLRGSNIDDCTNDHDENKNP